MIVLPDVDVTMAGVATIIFPSRPAGMDSWQFYNIAGIPTIIFDDYSPGSRFGILQILNDGSYAIASKVICPYGAQNTNSSNWFYADGKLFTNLNFDRSSSYCALSSFAFDPIDGLITGARTGGYFGAYGFNPGQWCFGAIHTGANYYPAFDGGDTSRLYGNAWSSGEVSGFDGSGVIYTSNSLSYKNFTSSNNNIAQFQKYYQTNPRYFRTPGSPSNDGNTSPLGQGYIAYSYGNAYYGADLIVDICQLNVITESFRANCGGNDLYPIIEVLNSINISKTYPGKGFWYGPHAVYQPFQNTLSCSIQCGGSSPLRQRLIVMDMQGNFIKCVTLLNNNWNWYSWLGSDAYVYSVWYDGNVTMYLNKSVDKVDIDINFSVPSKISPPLKTPFTDTRKFYRSK